MIQKSPLEELIAEQKLLCEEFDSAYIKVSGDDVVAVAVETLNQEPIVGIRKKPETEENVAWFIYGGELGDGEDFFQTMPVRELQDILPEAMAWSVPVISSNSGGLPEVNFDGVSGYLSNVGDIENMAENAVKILKEDAVLAQFRTNALNIAKQFDIKNILPLYENLYLQAIKETQCEK